MWYLWKCLGLTVFAVLKGTQFCLRDYLLCAAIATLHTELQLYVLIAAISFLFCFDICSLLVVTWKILGKIRNYIILSPYFLEKFKHLACCFSKSTEMFHVEPWSFQKERIYTNIRHDVPPRWRTQGCKISHGLDSKFNIYKTMAQGHSVNTLLIEDAKTF